MDSSSSYAQHVRSLDCNGCLRTIGLEYKFMSSDSVCWVIDAHSHLVPIRYAVWIVRFGFYCAVEQFMNASPVTLH
ncbi:hypothetical protein Acr_26g0004030 [Actinidia rufa]|uniref:Uncharacterized protein n=1 Tax=Actinidia rufa TaxID=165716 RepID=A0A7J0H1Z9_9ERIC|nr:hypothetical protein Acr_26g0004030 [Actinidia rufa]